MRSAHDTIVTARARHAYNMVSVRSAAAAAAVVVVVVVVVVVTCRVVNTPHLSCSRGAGPVVLGCVGSAHHLPAGGQVAGEENDDDNDNDDDMFSTCRMTDWQ